MRTRRGTPAPAVWSAVRHRRSQSIALVLVSALVTACAVFAPLFVRTLEQGLLRAGIVQRDPADTAAVLRATRTAERPGVAPSTLVPVLSPEARRWFEPGIGMTTADTDIVPAPGKQSSPVRLVARDGVCEHVTLNVGRCPTAPNEVLVSAADSARWGWTEGTELSVMDPSAMDAGDPTGKDARVQLAVTGVYEAEDDPAYWLRTEVDGKSGFPISVGLNIVPAVDDLITPQTTFDEGWRTATASVAFPLRVSEITLDNLKRVSTALGEPGSSAEDVSVYSPVPDLVASVSSGRLLVRSIVPLLAVQLALLALTVLVLVAHAAVGQRRPEIALARLRGRSRADSRRLVMGELTLTLLIGVPLGVGLAVLANEVLRRVVVPPGVPFEMGWAVPAAAALAVAASLVVVASVVRPVLQEPVASLLRRVPPSTHRGLGVLDSVVVAVAVVAVVGLVTGDVSGPTALLVPVVLALAVGLLGSVLVRAVADRAGARALASGRLAAGLAWLSVARRPSLRHVLVVVTTATALVTFAANAVVVGERNRTARAETELGAPAVLQTEASSPTALAAAVDGLDPPLAELTTPVVVVRPRDPGAVPTLLARPGDLESVGFLAAGVALDVAALTPPTVPTVTLDGAIITGALSWALTDIRDEGEIIGVRPNSPSGIPGGDLRAAPGPLRIGITVTTPDGKSFDRDLAFVAQTASGATDLRAPVLCPQTCRLAALWLKGTDPSSEHVKGRITLSGLALDGAPLLIGDPQGWLDPRPTAAAGSLSVTGSGADLVLDVDATDRRLTATRRDVPVPSPVALAGRPPADAVGDDFTLTGLGGRPVPARAVQEVAALPGVGGRGALSDLDAALRQGGPAPVGSSLEVWVATEDPDVLAAVSRGVGSAGVPVASTTTLSERRAAYERSATGWGLLLGVFTGVMALLVSALVVVVVAVTSWRGVARDLAGLRVAGVPLRDLRSAVRREQVFMVVVGVLLGAACGILGSFLAIGLIPLFDQPSTVPAPQLAPAWGAIVAAGLASLLVVGAGALLAGRGVLARAVPSRLREPA